MSVKAIQGVTRTLRTLVDGTLRIQIDFEPVDRNNAMGLFGDPGTVVAMAVVNQSSARMNMQQRTISESAEPTEKNNESWRKIVFQSALFRTPEVWKVMGTDAQFLQWVRTNPCRVCKARAPSEAAHVRRVASGAGTGIKPEYAAIALCSKHHKQQHDHGEGHLGGKELFNKWRIESVHAWCWVQMKKDLGCSSMKEASLKQFYDWLFQKGLTEKLSRCVDDRLNDDDEKS